MIIGDIHGHTTPVRRLVSNTITDGNVMILGDMNIGFGRDTMGELSDIATDTGNQIYFIDGNHDNHKLIYKHLPDRHVRSVTEIMPSLFFCDRGSIVNFNSDNWVCFGGAVSIDKARCTPDVNWWSTENHTQEDIDAINVLANVGLDIHGIFCHQIPYSALPACLPEWHKIPFFSTPEIMEESWNNCRLMQAIVDSLNPARVIHGHMHRTYDTFINNVRYDGVSNLDGGRSPFIIL